MTDIVVSVPREQAVRSIIVSLEAMIREQLPGFALLPTAQRRRITNAGNVPDDFLEAVAVAIESTPSVAAPSAITPAEIRAVIADSRLLTSLADQLELMARGVRATTAERRAGVGKRALIAYSVAKSVNRHLDLTVTIPHLENMRRTLGRSGRRRRPAQSPAAPAANGGAPTQT